MSAIEAAPKASSRYSPGVSFRAAMVLLAAAAALLAPPARADVDTEHMFGFTEGTDIGTPHQAEAELETIGAFGRAAGTYNTQWLTASLKYPLSEQFRIAPAITFARFDISGVPDFDDRNQVALNRLWLEFRYHPFNRETSLFGLTFVAAPFVGFVDDVTGAPADAWGGVLLAAVDRALIPERLYAALNLVYDFERVRDYGTGLMTDSSTLGMSAAGSTRLEPWLYVGAEARYLRAFDGLAFGNLVGQAVYVGPVFYMTLGKGASLSGAWNIQAWGQTTGVAPGLDLTFFDSQRFKLRLAIEL